MGRGADERETNDDDDDDDDDDTERRDDANGERTKDERVDFESEGFEGRGGREDKNQSNDDDEKALSSRDASSARERSFEHETSARWVSSDENWLDDPRSVSYTHLTLPTILRV